MKRISTAGAWAVLLGTSLWALPVLAHSGHSDDGKEKGKQPLYQNDFSKAKVGSVSEDIMVLAGDFAVKEEKGNRFLELPGEPLDTFGILFGPTRKAGVTVSAKIIGEARGRRYPAFAVGLNGYGGYRLQVSPGKRAIELYKGDEVLKKIPFRWKPGTWYSLKLQSKKIEGPKWELKGKVWQTEAKKNEEPDWMIRFQDKEEPYEGRASIWGIPYSGKPIRFDNLKVTEVGE